MSEFTQLSNLMRGALKAAEGEAAPQKDSKVTVTSAKEAFNKAINNSEDSRNFESVLKPIFKDLGTTDIGALRLVTITEPTAQIIDPDTAFLNWLSRKASQRVYDYQARIKERDAGTTVALPFNMDDTQPAIHQSSYAARYNTLTALGFRTKQSMLAKDMANQQGQDDVAEDNLRDAMTLINRGLNKVLLANTEVTSEALGQVPQMGGFLTRTVTNATNEGSTDLAEGDLDGAIAEICGLLGWNTQLMLMVGNDQIAVIDDIMIDRFPGTDPMTHFLRTNSLLASQMAASGVDVKTCYSDRRTKPVPVVMETQLPANTAVLFAAEYPQLGEYKFNGSGGFHMLVLPEATNYDVSLVFRLATLLDPVEKSRHKFSAVG